MSLCPKCQFNIDEDFGLVTCPNCRAQVMISMDGESAIEPDNLSDSMEAAQVEDVLTDEINEMDNYEPEVSSNVPVNQSNAVPPSSSDMSDVTAFANSTASQGRDGLLKFNIYINGIDSAELRSQLIDILGDERFLWDPRQLLLGVKEGQLKIEDLSAVKSSILVQKLRSLPIEIRWEQHAIYS